ncbi:MAG TPA: selenocysteine-specific translation elongation factor [Vicinamibacteria bacterium]|nr:selenocysteine-specific translation elongation factor [Vicinamibacteria bacterium]
MGSLIVGTAGHIDHGKSALVRALTGTDPDRLKEEKERGITIDLGFAHLDLGEGLVASFIDVPGHERFVRNMLAGAHGLDAVLLVVAADESVMPQTREHFHICRLLDVPSGLVVLSKCDLADADMLALAELEVRELVHGSFLEAAPILRVSAKTGAGLDHLRSALRDLAAGVGKRADQGLLRLPVDRVFTLRGFGTVVTGTLVSGSLQEGAEVEILPAGLRSRVRGLQVHGEPASRVEAGQRAAVNLTGIEVSELTRGDVVARPGSFEPTSLLDVRLSLLPGEKPLEDQTRVRVHLKSAEVLARARILGAPKIDPGASGLAQLRLESRAVAGWGDRLILRSYSPPVTIGGAVVLDPLPPRKRRSHAGSLPSEAEAREQAALRMVQDAGLAGLPAPRLAMRLTIPVEQLARGFVPVAGVVAVGRDPVSYLSHQALTSLTEATLAELTRFHRDNPLKAALPREELRRRTFAHAPPGAFEQVVDSLAEQGKVRLGPDAVALAGREVRLTPAEESARQALIEAAQAAGLQGLNPSQPPAGLDPRLAERVARVLAAEGILARVGELLVHREHLAALKAEVRRRWPPGSRLDVTAFKELTGLSRKFVIPLLEYLDRERVTRRSGQDRLVLSG